MVKENRFQLWSLLFSYRNYYEQIDNSIQMKLEDLPFEIPENWIWIKLKNLGIINGGFTPKQNEISPKGKIPYFKVSDMNYLGNEVFMNVVQQYYIGNKKGFLKNSIIFPKNGGAVFTNKKRVLITESIVDLNTGVFTPLTINNFDYIFLLFKNIDFKNFYKGTALPTIDKEKIENIYIALPPLNEQKRIIQKYELIDSLI